jgi:hypothetical protein
VLIAMLIFAAAIIVHRPNPVRPEPAGTGTAVDLSGLGPQYRLTADIRAEQYRDGGFIPRRIPSGSVVTILGDPHGVENAGTVFVLFGHEDLRMRCADLRQHSTELEHN